MKWIVRGLLLVVLVWAVMSLVFGTLQPWNGMERAKAAAERQVVAQARNQFRNPATPTPAPAVPTATSTSIPTAMPTSTPPATATPVPAATNPNPGISGGLGAATVISFTTSAGGPSADHPLTIEEAKVFLLRADCGYTPQNTHLFGDDTGDNSTGVYLNDEGAGVEWDLATLPSGIVILDAAFAKVDGVPLSDGGVFAIFPTSYGKKVTLYNGAIFIFPEEGETAEAEFVLRQRHLLCRNLDFANTPVRLGF